MDLHLTEEQTRIPAGGPGTSSTMSCPPTGLAAPYLSPTSIRARR